MMDKNKTRGLPFSIAVVIARIVSGAELSVSHVTNWIIFSKRTCLERKSYLSHQRSGWSRSSKGKKTSCITTVITRSEDIWGIHRTIPCMKMGCRDRDGVSSDQKYQWKKYRNAPMFNTIADVRNDNRPDSGNNVWRNGSQLWFNSR